MLVNRVLLRALYTNISIEQRHLGLVPAVERENSLKFIDIWSEVIKNSIDLDRLVEIAKTAPKITSEIEPIWNRLNKQPVKIGVAYDEVFNFYYMENIESLEANNAKIKYFSPLNDEGLPDADGLYIGGGYPELFSKELSDYARIIEGIIKEKPHTISKEKEELVAGMGEFSDFSELFEKLTGSEIEFEDVIVDGKPEKLNDSTYSRFTKSVDSGVRKQAYDNLLSGYKNFNLTLSHNLLNQLKEQNFKSKTYNFESTFKKAMFYEEVDEKIFFNLIERINQNLGLYQKYNLNIFHYL